MNDNNVKANDRKIKLSTRRLVLNAIMLALLIISSKMAIPTAYVPFTLQLLVAFIIAFTTKKFDGVTIFIIYIILGLIGIPVFANGGGLGYVYSPSFGFILGFLVMDIVIVSMSRLLYRFGNKGMRYRLLANFISSIIGLLILYTIGFIYAIQVFNVYLNKDFTLLFILQLTVIPYIGFDIIKCIIANIVAVRLGKIISGS